MCNKFFLFILITILILIDIIIGKQEKFSSKIKCYSCNGTNPQCSQNPSEVDYIKCYTKELQCYTWTAYGLNYRGCYVENTWPCFNASNCEICEGSKCNNNIIPKNRLNCYHCNGEDCSKMNKKRILPCVEHKEDNACFTFRDDKTNLIIERGCVSLSAQCNSCLNNKDHCKICDSDNCNDHIDWEVPSTVSTETSTISTRPITISTLPTTISTEIIQTSEKTTEGSEKSTPKPINFSCYKCRSDILPSCINSNLDLIQSFCRVDVTEETKGCYIDVHDDGVIYRGCLVDILDKKVLEKCKSEDYEKCEICYKENCNYGAPPGSGSIAHKISFGIFITVIFIWFKI